MNPTIPQRVTSSGQVTTSQTTVLNTADQVTRRANILMYTAGVGAILGAVFGAVVGYRKHQ